MTYSVRFVPRALEQLDDVQIYIEAVSSVRIAATYVESIIEYCESIATFSVRGVPRNDIRDGIRITHYRGRAIIAFTASTGTATILGIFYGAKTMRQR